MILIRAKTTCLALRWGSPAAHRLVCALGFLACVGCSPHQGEAPPEPVAGRSASTISSEHPAAAAPTTVPAPAATEHDPQPEAKAGPGATDHVAISDGLSRGASPSTTPHVDPALRALVGRYLVSDGQGAYRPQEAAATALESLPPDQCELLWTLLSDPEVQVRRGAAFFLLGLFDPQQPRHVQAYAALLADPDRTVRGLALAALRQSPRATQLAQLDRVTLLLDVAQEPYAEHRATVARWLGQFREDARSVLPGLSSAARSDPDPRVRGAALAAVSQVAPAEAALPVLLEALDDREPSVRLVAAARLRQMDAAAAPAADRLAERLADEDSRVAQAAAEALLRIGSPAVVVLSRQLSNPHPAVRRLALTVLTELGASAAPARSQIEACLKDDDSHVRKLAEGLLNRLPAR